MVKYLIITLLLFNQASAQTFLTDPLPPIGPQSMVECDELAYAWKSRADYLINQSSNCGQTILSNCRSSVQCLNEKRCTGCWPRNTECGPVFGTYEACLGYSKALACARSKGNNQVKVCREKVNQYQSLLKKSDKTAVELTRKSVDKALDEFVSKPIQLNVKRIKDSLSRIYDIQDRTLREFDIAIANIDSIKITKETSQKLNQITKNFNNWKINNGYQIIKYDNGRYEGFLKNGQRHGYGIYYWNNGDKFTGNWVNAKRTGLGVYYWKDGNYIEGIWSNSKVSKITKDSRQRKVAHRKTTPPKTKKNKPRIKSQSYTFEQCVDLAIRACVRRMITNGISYVDRTREEECQRHQPFYCRTEKESTIKNALETLK